MTLFKSTNKHGSKNYSKKYIDFTRHRVNFLSKSIDSALVSFQEFCYYAGVIVLYFFANLFLAIHACVAGHKAGCVSIAFIPFIRLMS